MSKRADVNCFRGRVEHKAALHKRFSHSSCARKNYAFTLAEVLITLGIIGVVAAMVIPSLISNIRSARIKTQLKKTVATLNQAVKMSVARYDFDFAGASEASDLSKLDPNTTNSVASMLAGTLAGVTITDTLKMNDGTEYVLPPRLQTPRSYLYAKLSDGSIFAFDKNAKDCTIPQKDDWMFPHQYMYYLADKGCYGFIDTNGVTQPNEDAICKHPPTTDVEDDPKCEVPSSALGDIYPVVFYDGTVEPQYNVGRLIIGGK